MKSRETGLLYTCVYLFHFVQVKQWGSEKASLDQQLCLLEQQTQEEATQLQQSITNLQSERQILQGRVVCKVFKNVSVIYF